MSEEGYQGWANRETWAFNLHWTNDQGLYNETLEETQRYLAGVNDEASDYELGENIVGYWQEVIADYDEAVMPKLPEALRMMRDEVGSWWRINHAEVGAAIREHLSGE